MTHYHDLSCQCYFYGLFHGALFAAVSIFVMACIFGVARHVRTSQGRCGITARAVDPFGKEHVHHGFYTPCEARAWTYKIANGEQVV